MVTCVKLSNAVSRYRIGRLTRLAEGESMRKPILTYVGLVIVLCGACATTATSPQSPPTAEIARASSCPLAFAPTGSCVPQDSPVNCEYPGFTCVCQQPCGGGAALAPAPAGPPANPFRWECLPKPPRVRADGCPGASPQSGASCRGSKSCVYTLGCTGVASRCAKGVWTTPELLPPPP